MPDYYSTKQAAQLTGASPQSIRAYSASYRRFFSSEGAPEPGHQRKLTGEDLRLIRFISQSTAAGLSHEQVAERLGAGALDQFDWQPQPEPIESEPEPDITALVPLSALRATQALMQDAQRREAEIAERAQAQQAELQAEIQRLTLELGRAEGELAALKAHKRRPPKWWLSLFGGRSQDL